MWKDIYLRYVWANLVMFGGIHRLVLVVHIWGAFIDGLGLTLSIIPLLLEKIQLGVFSWVVSGRLLIVVF